MNLIEALHGRDADHGVCTTFAFEPLFFGNYAIDQLQSAGIATPVVLMDGQRYQDLARNAGLSSRAIGQHYYLEPIVHSGVFHPKIVFLAGEDDCHVGVSSANLTLGEYTTAAQLGQTITLTTGEDEPDPTAISITQDVRGFVRGLASEYVSGRDAGIELERCLEISAWLTDYPAPGDVSTRFIHNLSTPLLPQVMGAVGSVETATLFAPFFGGKRALGELAGLIGADQYEILVADNNTHLDPETAIEVLDGQVSFRPLEHESKRWIHAKGIILEGPWGRATLYGSPNITGQALLEPAQTGNIETALLDIESSPDREAGLWGQPAFSVRPGPEREVSTFEFAEYSHADCENEEQPSLMLEDAHVDRYEGNQLVARLVAASIPDGATVTLETLSGETTTAVWNRIDEEGLNGVRVAVPESWTEQLVRVRTASGEASNYRQITTEPTQGSRQMGDMLGSGGRHGVQELADEALFFDVPVAFNVLSQSATVLTEKAQRGESVNEEQPDDETEEPAWASGASRVSTARNRPQHLELKDGIQFQRRQIEDCLTGLPTVASAEALLDHFTNLWYLITRGLARSALTPQIEAHQEDRADGDEDGEVYETELNVERMHEICSREAAAIFRGGFLGRVTLHLNRVYSVEPESTRAALDDDQLLDVFVSRPAMVLALMEWHDEAFVERFRLLCEYHHGMTESPPHIGELLLDGHRMEQRLEDYAESLAELIASFSERIDCPLSLPGEFDVGIELLLFGVWTIELSQQRPTPLFDNQLVIDRYGAPGLARMATLAIRGHERVESDAKYRSLKKGHFDPVVRMMDGRVDPRPQLERLIELD